MELADNHSLAFSGLNLRCNPFGELDASDRAALAVVALEHLVVELTQPRTVIEFVAGHGRGKSTHLLALHRRVGHGAYVKVRPDERPVFPDVPLLFIDSFELLPARARKQILAQMQSLAVTAHHSGVEEFSAAGFRVVTEHVSCKNANVLQSIFQRRVTFARRSPGPVPTISSEMVASLQRQYGDDVRAMEQDLYEQFQNLEQSANVEM